MKSSKHNRLTGTLFRRYLVQCIFWAAALIVAGTLFDFIIQRLPMFYQERWYMSYRTLYVGCAGVALWALVVLFSPTDCSNAQQVSLTKSRSLPTRSPATATNSSPSRRSSRKSPCH